MLDFDVNKSDIFRTTKKNFVVTKSNLNVNKK